MNWVTIIISPTFYGRLGVLSQAENVCGVLYLCLRWEGMWVRPDIEDTPIEAMSIWKVMIQQPIIKYHKLEYPFLEWAHFFIDLE